MVSRACWPAGLARSANSGFSERLWLKGIRCKEIKEDTPLAWKCTHKCIYTHTDTHMHSHTNTHTWGGREGRRETEIKT